MTKSEITSYLKQIFEVLRKKQSEITHKRAYIQITDTELADFLKRKALYSFTVDTCEECITPILQDWERYPRQLPPRISVNDFLLKHVHPHYLIPYLVYAEVSHEIALNPRLPAALQELCRNVYQISVPMQFAEDPCYYWYTQQSVIKTATSTGIIIKHLNLYNTQRQPFFKFEKRILDAKILKDGQLIAAYNERLIQKMNYFFLHPFLYDANKKTHLLILIFYQHFLNEEYREDVKEKTIATWMSVTTQYIKIIKSEILANLKHRQLDYFNSVNDFSEFVKEAGCLQLTEEQIIVINNILNIRINRFPKKQQILEKLKEWGIKPAK